MTSQLLHSSSVMTVMTKAVIKASKGLLRDFAELEHLQVSVKSNKTFVTNADIKADKILKEELLYARPTYSLVSEESNEFIGESPQYRWIIDPLDGTVNYMHGFPHWAISVALEKDKEIIAAVTYDPIKDEMFTAEKGCGAYLNNKKIKVSGRKSLEDLLISVGSFGAKNMHNAAISASLRRTGSATLDMAYIAAGRMDILFCYNNSLNIWDTAAGMLLIKEAGGVLAGKDGLSISNNYLDLAIMCNVNLLSAAMKIYTCNVVTNN